MSIEEVEVLGSESGLPSVPWVLPLADLRDFLPILSSGRTPILIKNGTQMLWTRNERGSSFSDEVGAELAGFGATSLSVCTWGRSGASDTVP